MITLAFIRLPVLLTLLQDWLHKPLHVLSYTVLV